MRRAIEFCKWKANWWAERQTARETGVPHLDEGIKSYALEQANIEQQRMVAWAAQWGAIWLRAATVLANHLGEEEGAAELDTLHVEIEDDDDMLAMLDTAHL